jgi:hypothetical protein
VPRCINDSGICSALGLKPWTEVRRFETVSVGDLPPSVREAAHTRRPLPAELLDIEVGAPILTVYDTGHADDGTAIWSERTSFRGDSYEYHNTVTAGPATRPAAGWLTERDRADP